jgi:hypothetical protein
VVNDSLPTGWHSAHSKRKAGGAPMAEVSDLRQNKHWIEAQSGARQQSKWHGCSK